MSGSVEAVALRSETNFCSRSAAALAFNRIGIDCTKPKQAPTTNSSAVVAFGIEAPPNDSLNRGAANTTAPSSTYM